MTTQNTALHETLLNHDEAQPLAAAARYLAQDDSRDLAATIVSSILLFLLIFGLSATVDIRHLRQELRNKFALATGVVMQFLIMPLLGFAAVVALKGHGLSQAAATTLLVVTSSPGGSYSNWWCSTFNADLALSVAMTAVSTILSIGLLPANLLFYSYLVYGVTEEQSVVQALDLKSIFISLAIVITAILLGLYASYKIDKPWFHKLANRLGSISGVCLILVSVFLSSKQESTSVWNQHWSFYVGVAFPCLIGIVLANFFCYFFKLKKPEQVAISIECCYQNVGIATSVAVNMFSDPIQRGQALAVPLFYGIMEAIIIGIYCVGAWKLGWTKAPRHEKLCVVVTRTYEITGHDHDDSSDDDERLEEAPSPEEEQHLSGWRKVLAWPFVPRYPEHGGGASATRRPEPQQHDTVENDVEMATPAKKERSDTATTERSRFVSEDYTAATSSDDISPPNTPGVATLSEEEEIVSEEAGQEVELPQELLTPRRL